MSKYSLICKSFFKNFEGNPFSLTQTQERIFEIVFEKDIKRGSILSFTQAGKSTVVSLALISAMVKRKEKIIIVSPSEKQSKIIMNNVIEHFFDNSLLRGMLDYDNKQIDRLKQEKSKNRITTRNGSEVMILTANVREVQKNAKNLLGFGCSLLIIEESSLIPTKIYSKIIRMVGGTDGKIVHLGNAIQKNHFYKTFQDDRYVTVKFDYKHGIAEGRITKEFIEEARENMDEIEFGILYECKFPEGGADNILIPEEWLWIATKNKETLTTDGSRQAGLDIARFGRDSTIYAFREGQITRAIRETYHKDTMEVVGWSRKFIDKDMPDQTLIDVVGLGAGVNDRLDELGYEVYPFNAGSKPTSDGIDKYYNLRSQVFFNLRDKIRPINGKSSIWIPPDKKLITELASHKYKFSSEKKRRILSKDEIKADIGRSPDMADAIAMAFFDISNVEPQMYIG